MEFGQISERPVERGRLFDTLSAAEKEAIRDLESSPYDRSDIKLILATLFGKRASQIKLHNEDMSAVEAQSRDFENLLDKFGFHYIHERRDRYVGDGRYSYTTLNYIFSKREVPAQARKFFEHIQHTDKALIDARHREFGALMDYPQTAIEAFVTVPRGTLITPFDDFGDDEEARRFAYFRPSPDHWREESLLFKDLAKKVKDISPSLYKKIMQVK